MLQEITSLPSRERGLKWDCKRRRRLRSVAPLAGAWIEILLRDFKNAFGESLPSRERGLKYISGSKNYTFFSVAPLAGAWIEIGDCPDYFGTAYVAPLAGAWIEIFNFHGFCLLLKSLPSRERGLKWNGSGLILRKCGRSPRGSVD